LAKTMPHALAGTVIPERYARSRCRCSDMR
jgi:hypothetical protein